MASRKFIESSGKDDVYISEIISYLEEKKPIKNIELFSEFRKKRWHEEPEEHDFYTFTNYVVLLSVLKGFDRFPLCFSFSLRTYKELYGSMKNIMERWIQRERGLERCPSCNGKGKVLYHDSNNPDRLKVMKCSDCDGKGYVQSRNANGGSS